MTIGVLLTAIISGSAAVAVAIALNSGPVLAALSYSVGGLLGVSVFVALVECQRR